MVEGAGYQIVQGDAIDALGTLPERSVHAICCSPPYFRLRSYLPAGHPDKARELGQERTPAEYVAGMVAVFAAAMRVLRDDGTLWVVIGDSWAAHGRMVDDVEPSKAFLKGYKNGPSLGRLDGYTRKSLIGVPWRLAFGLQDAGWLLRQDLIWHKRAPMPSSATDRFCPAHEYIFLFSKRPRYYFDHVAVAEPAVKGAAGSTFTEGKTGINGNGRVSLLPRQETETRVRRSVFTLGPEPLDAAHYAAYPTRIPELALLAGTSAYGCCARCGAPWRRVVERERARYGGSPVIDGRTAQMAGHSSIASLPSHLRTDASRSGMGTPKVIHKGWEPSCRCGTAEVVPALVVDPFCGSGSTAIAALRNGRRFWGCELYENYVEMARSRIDASLHAGNVLDGPKVRPVDGQLPLFADQEEAASPLLVSQGASGIRTYVGFNQRYKEKHG